MPDGASARALHKATRVRGLEWTLNMLREMSGGVWMCGGTKECKHHLGGLQLSQPDPADWLPLRSEQPIPSSNNQLQAPLDSCALDSQDAALTAA